MKPNNIENQIREKFNAREIQPSAHAWDRLDAMLTVGEENKPKRFPYWLIGIAVSILVLLTVGLFFFNQEKAIISNDTTIVNTKKENTSNNPFVEIQNSNQVTTSEINIQKLTFKNQGVSIISNENNQNPIINRQKNIKFLVNEGVEIKNLTNIETGEKSVFPKKDENQNQFSSNGIVSAEKSPNYIDALLASDESVAKTHPKSKKIIVDANSLLSQADGEVEQTFREKVINSVSKNIQEIKVALINRNQE